jgi:apolipoprotein D and lipocalin family protein
VELRFCSYNFGISRLQYYIFTLLPQATALIIKNSKQKTGISLLISMKRQNIFITMAAGAGVAAVAYTLLSKKNIPDGASAVQPFDKDRYMGLWYEVARLPSFIEKNIIALTEDYIPNADGTFKVITKGYDTEKQKWSSFEGKIKSAGAADVGMLKVSYFGPAYLSYNVLAVDDDYQNALVSGSGLDYLWILSRQTTIADDVKERFLSIAGNIGFAVEKLEWPSTTIDL